MIRKRSSFSAAMLSTVSLLAVAGCASQKQGLNAAQPSTLPARPNTPYTGTLACLNHAIAAKPVAQPVTISVGMIPDATGRIIPGLRDMVSTAVSQVAIGSQAYNLTEVGSYGMVVGPHYASVQDPAGTLVGVGGVRVSGGYQLVGALTQADSANSDQSLSGGVSWNQKNGANQTFDASVTNTTSTLALDLRLVDVSHGLTVAYATHSVMTVRTYGVGVNANFTIGTVGGNIGYNDTISEGPHQAVRELVELSVAELMAQAAHVPYWGCFGVGGDDPKIMSMIEGWYTGMSDSATDADMRVRLRSAGYDVPDAPKPMIRALISYQSDNGLVPTGRADYQTFASLVMRQVPVDAPITSMPAANAPVDGAKAMAPAADASKDDKSK